MLKELLQHESIAAAVASLFIAGCSDAAIVQHPVDPCAGVDCSGHGTCTGGSCSCDAGYTATDCSSCANGYVPSGDNCVTPTDPCAGVDCSGHGTCTGGSCSCGAGYTGTDCSSCANGYVPSGDNCVTPTDPCAGVDCSGHGTCTGGSCRCDAGYTGTDCSSCANGYVPSGDNCVTPTDPCAGVDCSGHGTCTGGNCRCDAGYTGTDCSSCANGYVPDGDRCVADTSGNPSYTANRWACHTGTGSGDGSQGDPWTLEQAMALATEGDQVGVCPGVYNIVAGDAGTGTGRDATLHPTQNGSSGSRIVFFATNRAIHNSAGETILRTTSGSGSVLGKGPNQTSGGNYTTYDGFRFEVDTGYAAWDTGSVFTNWESVGVRVLGCEFDFGGFDPGGTLNWGSIFSQSSTELEIADNLFTNQALTNEENHATILFYGTNYYDIHHNEFLAVNLPFFPKGVPASRDLVPGSFHHNLVNASAKPFELGGVGSLQQGIGTLDIYQNIFDLEGEGRLIWRSYDSSSPGDVRVANNLFWAIASSGEGGFYGSGSATEADTRYSNSIFQNNIWTDVGDGEYYYTWQTGASLGLFVSRLVHDHNCWDGVTAWYNGATSFTEWREAGAGASSVDADPLLADPANGDYRLSDSTQSIGSGDSPCLGQGEDVLNLLGGGTSASINIGPYVRSDQSDIIGIRAAQ